jgi:hypothetical protein
MWRCVDIVLTNVSEERIASIFRVEENERKSARNTSYFIAAPQTMAAELIS